MNEIVPNLWLGDMADAQASLPDSSIAIVCVLESNPFPQGRADYYWLPFLDKTTAEGRRRALDGGAGIIHSFVRENRKVLVHCGAGIERSPLAVAWYLVWAKLQPDLDAAYGLIASKRPQVQDRRAWIQ